MMRFSFHTKLDAFEINLEADKGKWLISILQKVESCSEKCLSYNQVKADYEAFELEDFELFWYSKNIEKLRQNGLLVL